MTKNKNGLIKYLEKHGKTSAYSWQELAEKFGYERGETARNTWLNYRTEVRNNPSKAQKLSQKPKYREVELQNIIAEQEELIVDMNLKEGKAKASFGHSIAPEAMSIAQVYEECKMDPTKWELTRIWHKKRATGFVYSANFDLKKHDSPTVIGVTLEDVLKNYKSDYQPLHRSQIIQNNSFKRPCAAYISLTDAHIDKYQISREPVEERIATYKRTLDVLLLKAYHSHLIDEIVYVIGNDFFNSDTFYSTTTNGTQQYNNSEWYDSYEMAFDLQVNAINRMKQFCNTLHIKFVPGNHDRTKSFFLLHALAVYFQSDKNIIFDRSAEDTKVYLYGDNFIGMHHGDTKVEKLPLFFASKFYKEWGTAKHKEIGLGDKHHKKSWQLKLNVSEDEMEGIRMFMTPALCKSGQWDKSKMFDNSIPAGICRVYDREKGKITEFEERI